MPNAALAGVLAALAAVALSGCLEMMRSFDEEACAAPPGAPFPFTVRNERDDEVALTFTLRDGESRCPLASRTLALTARDVTTLEVPLPARDVTILMQAVGPAIEFTEEDSFQPTEAVGYAIAVTRGGIEAGRVVP